MEQTQNVPANLPDYVRRYLAGESMQDIARDLGIARSTIYKHMLSDLGDLHESVVTAMLVTRVAQADEKLDTAGDAVDIARAREQARFARMDLERRRPNLYGQQTKVMHEIGPDLGSALREARKRVAQTTHAAVQLPDNASNALDGTAQRVD